MKFFVKSCLALALAGLAQLSTQAAGFSAAWSASGWSGGYTANLTTTNNSTPTVTGWTATFTTSQAEMSVWNACSLGACLDGMASSLLLSSNQVISLHARAFLFLAHGEFQAAQWRRSQKIHQTHSSLVPQLPFFYGYDHHRGLTVLGNGLRSISSGVFHHLAKLSLGLSHGPGHVRHIMS